MQPRPAEPEHQAGSQFPPWTIALGAALVGLLAWWLWVSGVQEQRQRVERLAVESVISELRTLVNIRAELVGEIANQWTGQPATSHAEWTRQHVLDTRSAPRMRGVAWLSADGATRYTVEGTQPADAGSLDFLGSPAWREKLADVEKQMGVTGYIVATIPGASDGGNLVAVRSVRGERPGAIVAVFSQAEMLNEMFATSAPGFDVEVSDGTKKLYARGNWSAPSDSASREMLRIDEVQWIIRMKLSVAHDALPLWFFSGVVLGSIFLVSLLLGFALQAVRAARRHAFDLDVIRGHQAREIEERKRAEEKLAVSESTFRVLTENATDLISRHALDGRYLYASPASLRLLGYAPEELVGRAATEFYHPADAGSIAQNQERLLQPPHEARFIYRILRKDGAFTWFETVARALRDHGSGEIVEIQCASRDISRRVGIERALRESEERFRSAFEMAAIGMALVGLDGKWLRVNQALCEMLGYSGDELAARTFQEITHPEDLARDLELNRELLSGGRRSYQMEKRYVRSDRRLVWVFLGVSLLRDDAGEPLYFVKQVENIDQRKQAEEELLRSEERFRELFDFGFEFKLLLSPFGVVLEANSTALQFAELRPEDARGQPAWETSWWSASENSVERLREAVARSARGGIVRFEAEMFGANGRRADVDLSIKPIISGGLVAALIVEARDVTEKKRTEDLVRRSLRDKEVLLQEVHHRVKNNLQVVSSMLNIQAAHAPDVATRTALQEAVARIRSMALVHEKLYRSDDLGGINFADYAGTLTAQIFRTLAPANGRVTLRTDVSAFPLTVARAVPLALILNELVSNALKHAFPDDRAGMVTVRLGHDDERAFLEVADDGVGFAGTFSQLARNSLGLTLVDALSRQLQAELDVSGPPGTRVSVSFALDDAPASAVREETNNN